MPRKILIVDDDQKTRLLLKTYLEKNQYEVILAHNGESFLAELHAHAEQLSLVILDVMLPDTDGFALCRIVRQRSNLPIIMLTASSDETDRVVGLELGADDYIAKPYSPRELLARIKAILRRAGADPAPTVRAYHFNGFTLDLAERTVVDSEGAPLALTGLDFQLLNIFRRTPRHGAGPQRAVRGNARARFRAARSFAGRANQPPAPASQRRWQATDADQDGARRRLCVFRHGGRDPCVGFGRSRCWRGCRW
jgi:two-component system, OmpR family, response regulator